MMMIQWLCFFFLFLSSSSQMPIVQSRCNHQAEISALLHFKDMFEINCTGRYAHYYYFTKSYVDSIGYPKTSTWDNAESLLNGTTLWDGVECDPVKGHVIGLDLSSSCLRGSINSSAGSIVSHLVHLENLNLAFNNFQGSSIPSELGNLSRLIYLNLSASYFEGQVPLEISKLSMLTSLDLSKNFLGLELNLNSLVGNLTNLEELDLGYASLIPSEVPKLLFTNMASLRSLKLDSCGLKGEFPQGIFHLPKLQHLSIGGNRELEGHLPTEFNSSTTPLLESLVISATNFNVTIPVSIGNLVFLRELDLSYCKFSGPITAASLGNLTRLISLDLSNFNTFFPRSNNFTTLSSWLGKLTNLRYLRIAGANLIGEIPPSSLANLTNLLSLDLTGNRLTGQIPPSLANLTYLYDIVLSGNRLTGQIPPSLANLTDLSNLDLSGNILTGQIPSVLTKLTQLSYLVLEDNHLTGKIPPGFVNLKYLLVRNNMLSGPLPIQTLRNLEGLYVSNNQLNGTLELDLFLEFTNLIVLFLSSNNFTLVLQHQRNMCTSSTLPKFVALGLSSCQISKFPEFLQHQHDLEFLDLSYNSIEGPIPKWMGSIKSLQNIDLSHNFITGLDDPHLFLRLPILNDLDISFNKLRGSVPVPSLSALRIYRASNNQLTGQIPHSFCDLPSLEVLDFSSNHFTGELDPHCFSKASLTILNLRNNSFYGKIPEFCSFGMIGMIGLNNNQFQGKLPRSLANCAELEFFDAGNNLINDTFPYWLGSLRHLKVLLLNDNALHGSIGTMPNMTSGYWFPELIIIDLSRNSLSGNLTSCHFEQWIAMKTADLKNPSYMGQSTYPFFVGGAFYDYSLTMYNKGTETEYLKILNALITIDLSSNEFEGEIPSTVGDLRGLHFLNLSNNHLYGDIPSSFGSLTHMESLDLSSNRLSGQIPQQLAGLDFLSTFRVSHNNLSGLIPQGRHFDTFPDTSYLGNPGLCGAPLSKKCEISGRGVAQPPEEMAKKEDNFWDDLNAKILWMVVSIGFGGGLVVGVAFENTVNWRMLILYFRSRN